MGVQMVAAVDFISIGAALGVFPVYDPQISFPPKIFQNTVDKSEIIC